MRRSKPQRVRAVVRITYDASTDSDVDIYALARLRARTTDDILRLARHLGYERRAESVEVWTWKQRKRRVGERVGRVGDIKTCVRWAYSRWFAFQRGEKLLLRERTRVSRREVPKMRRRTA